MGRLEIAAYAGVGCPELHPDEITNYAPKSPQIEWSQLIKKATEVEDDGHTSKVIRALIQGQRASKEFEEKDSFLIKGNMWKTIAQMCELFHLPATQRHEASRFRGIQVGVR